MSGLVFLLRSAGFAFNEVVVSMLERPHGIDALTRFGLILAAITSAILLAIAITPLGEVTGTVTLDGVPLANARIVFQPESQYRASYGVTDSQGSYELIYLRDVAGAVIGRHKVLIDRLAEREGEAANPLPDEYNSRTKLKANIRSGSNSCDFALQNAQ